MGLPVVTLVMFASAAGVPTGVPIAVVLVLSGAYLVGSLPGLILAVGAVAAAELAGTMTLHGIARASGPRLLNRLSADRQTRVNAAVAQWRGRLGGRDVAAIAVLRLIPFVRMGTTVGSGLMGVRLRDFAAGSAIAAVIWTGVPIGLGYAFRANLESLERSYGRAMSALPWTLGVGGLLLAVTFLSKNADVRTRLGDKLANLWPGGRDGRSLPEIGQKSPPVAR